MSEANVEIENRWGHLYTVEDGVTTSLTLYASPEGGPSKPLACRNRSFTSATWATEATDSWVPPPASGS